ncbi:hypothetical protein GF402_07635 [Candidatus Fermentibacteria bacterium]|nr:hypothetical protein [Candidatus Fermentibacteria bacterium]
MTDVPGVLAVLLSLGGPIAIVVLVLVHNHRKRMKRYDTAIKATEAGRSIQEIEEVISMMENQKSSNGFLIAGIIVAGIGIGTILIGLLLGVLETSAGGIFLVVLGAAFILTWLLLGRRRSVS